VMLPPCDFAMAWQGEAEVLLPASHGVLRFASAMGQGISREKLQQGRVQIRSRHGDVAIQPDAARPRCSLRNLLQEQGIPPWQRELMPLLYCGDELVCVPGVALAVAYQARAAEPGILLSWHPGRQ
jgi:tRNA(Ile)-lysidine synthase